MFSILGSSIFLTASVKSAWIQLFLKENFQALWFTEFCIFLFLFYTKVIIMPPFTSVFAVLTHCTAIGLAHFLRHICSFLFVVEISSFCTKAIHIPRSSFAGCQLNLMGVFFLRKVDFFCSYLHPKRKAFIISLLCHWGTNIWTLRQVSPERLYISLSGLIVFIPWLLK